MNRRQPLLVFALLFSAAALTGIIRWIVSTNDPLWIDELHTAWAIHDDLASVADRAGQGNQTPLFFWVEWLVVSWFGQSPLSLRLAPIAFATLASFMAGLLVFRSTGCSIASGLVAVLLAIDATSIFYGSEARPYVLLHLLSILQVHFFARQCFQEDAEAQSVCATESNTSISPPAPAQSFLNFNNLILAGFTATLAATHFTGVFLIVAEFLFLILSGRVLRNNRTAIWLAIGTLVLVPLSWLANEVFEKRQDWVPVSSIPDLLNEFLTPLIMYTIAPFMCWAGFKLFCLLFQEKKSPDPPVRESAYQNAQLKSMLQLVGVWAITPIAIIAIVQLTGIAPMALPRYAMVGFVAFPIFGGIVVSQIESNWAKPLSGAMILLLAVAMNPIATHFRHTGEMPRLRNETWQLATDVFVESTIESAEPIYLFANLIEDHNARPSNPNKTPEAQPKTNRMIDYLKFPLAGILEISPERIIPRPTNLPHRFADSDIRRHVQNKRTWLIVRGTHETVNQIVSDFKSALSQDLIAQTKVSVLDWQGSDIILVKVESSLPSPTSNEKPH